MNRVFTRAAVILTVALLAGCANLSDRHSPAQSAPPAGLQAQAERSAQALPPAALTLAESADSAAMRHDWSQASRQLERALNIAPHNPLLWQRLAAVRYSQGDYRQAQSFALKSNTYAGSDDLLRKLNWRIIAAARYALGDKAGAAEAERHARAL